MKKLALFLTLIILCTSLAAPVLAAPKAASEESSSSASSSAPASDASSDTASEKSKDKDKDKKSASSSDTGKESAPTADPGSVSSYPPPFADKLYSKAIYMINLDSDSVVYEKNAQEQMYPASLTKVMTCIVALESGIDLDNEKTALKAYIQNELYNLGVNTLGGIYMGEELTIRDLLYATMLQSANEAAMMVADYVGDGSIEFFCEMMNKKAKEIGAYNTNFSNASGLHDPNNYSTAYDLALIVKYAMQNPQFVEIVTTNSYTSQPTNKHPDGISWYSINEMQKSASEYYYQGLRGVKTGSLPASEVGGQGIRNYASTATRDGYSYLLICLGAPITDETGQQYKSILPFFDARDLYDWAFSTFKVKTLMGIGDNVAEVGVRLSWDVDHVNLLAQEKFASLVPNETTADSVQPFVEIDKERIAEVSGKKGEKEIVYINAPVKKGERIGSVKLMLNGEEVGRVPLVAAETIEQSKALYYLDKVKLFLNTFLFKFVITFVIVVLILYVILMIIRNRNKRRYQMRRRRPTQGK